MDGVDDLLLGDNLMEVTKDLVDYITGDDDCLNIESIFALGEKVMPEPTAPFIQRVPAYIKDLNILREASKAESKKKRGPKR
ncbi:hypothetical protein CHUAL_005926 [Chamberlinius hualienensis]